MEIITSSPYCENNLNFIKKSNNELFLFIAEILKSILDKDSEEHNEVMKIIGKINKSEKYDEKILLKLLEKKQINNNIILDLFNKKPEQLEPLYYETKILLKGYIMKKKTEIKNFNKKVPNGEYLNTSYNEFVNYYVFKLLLKEIIQENKELKNFKFFKTCDYMDIIQKVDYQISIETNDGNYFLFGIDLKNHNFKSINLLGDNNLNYSTYKGITLNSKGEPYLYSKIKKSINSSINPIKNVYILNIEGSIQEIINRNFINNLHNLDLKHLLDNNLKEEIKNYLLKIIEKETNLQLIEEKTKIKEKVGKILPQKTKFNNTNIIESKNPEKRKYKISKIKPNELFLIIENFFKNLDKNNIEGIVFDILNSQDSIFDSIIENYNNLNKEQSGKYKLTFKIQNGKKHIFIEEEQKNIYEKLVKYLIANKAVKNLIEFNKLTKIHTKRKEGIKKDLEYIKKYNKYILNKNEWEKFLNILFKEDNFKKFDKNLQDLFNRNLLKEKSLTKKLLNKNEINTSKKQKKKLEYKEYNIYLNDMKGSIDKKVDILSGILDDLNKEKVEKADLELIFLTTNFLLKETVKIEKQFLNGSNINIIRKKIQFLYFIKIIKEKLQKKGLEYNFYGEKKLNGLLDDLGNKLIYLKNKKDITKYKQEDIEKIGKLNSKKGTLNYIEGLLLKKQNSFEEKLEILDFILNEDKINKNLIKRINNIFYYQAIVLILNTKTITNKEKIIFLKKISNIKEKFGDNFTINKILIDKFIINLQIEEILDIVNEKNSDIIKGILGGLIDGTK